MPPLVDPTRSTQAYGDRALPRMNKELKSTELITRQRSLNALCDYLHDPEHIASALREGIPESLKYLLHDGDDMIRAKTTECLYILSSHAIGRDAILGCDLVPSLAKAFEDKDMATKVNAHKAIEMLSETPQGAEGIVEAGLVPILVKTLTTTTDDIKSIVLDTLHFCMLVQTEQVLENEGMEVLNKLLSHDLPLIRQKAARDMMDLSVTLAGKNKAVEVKAPQTLVQLLSDEKTEVRAMAAAAIMIITITTKGKYTALEFNAITSLLNLLEDECSEVRANALKALTCLAEAPEGRAALLEQVSKVRALMNDSVPNVVKAATIAVKVITWKP